MKAKIIALLVILFSGLIANSQVVTSEAAVRNSISFFQRYNHDRNDFAAHVIPYSDKSRAIFYIINFENNKGFLIHAAHKNSSPVIAFSFEGNLNPQNFTKEYQAWLNVLKNNLSLAVENNESPSEAITNEWLQLEAGSNVSENKTRSGVQPLLTTKWDQDCLYNESCPINSSGPCGHVLAGCVTIAASQIIKFWNYPASGADSVDCLIQGYHVNVNFQNANYNWGNMPDQLNASNADLSNFIYHAAVACGVQYGPYNTWGDLSTYTLTHFFKYSNDATKLNNFDDFTNWNTIRRDAILDNLNKGWPVYVGSQALSHALVCDGYMDTSMFHFNFGWGGQVDGYYKLSDIDVNNALINIHPGNAVGVNDLEISNRQLTVYPNPCVGNLHVSNETYFNGRSFKILSMMGQVILQGQVVSGNIDTHSLSVGNYMLEIQDNQTLFRTKLVKVTK